MTTLVSKSELQVPAKSPYQNPEANHPGSHEMLPNNIKLQKLIGVLDLNERAALVFVESRSSHILLETVRIDWRGGLPAVQIAEHGDGGAPDERLRCESRAVSEWSKRFGGNMPGGRADRRRTKEDWRSERWTWSINWTGIASLLVFVSQLSQAKAQPVGSPIKLQIWQKKV